MKRDLYEKINRKILSSNLEKFQAIKGLKHKGVLEFYVLLMCAAVLLEKDKEYLEFLKENNLKTYPYYAVMGINADTNKAEWFKIYDDEKNRQV